MLSANYHWRKRIPWLAARALRALPVWITLLLALAAVTNLLGIGLGGLPSWISRGLDLLSGFAAVFLGIFIEAAPFLLLGTLASGVVEVFIERDEIARWIPRSRFLGACAGSLFGMFFPVCECGVVPFTRRLIRKGVPVSVGIATLLAAPVLNPIVIASTLAAFGPGLVFWGRLALTLVIAIITSLVFSLHTDPDSLLLPAKAEDQMNDPLPVPLTALSGEGQGQAVEKPALNARFRRVMVIAVDEFFEMGRYLVIGSVLAALLQTFVYQSALLRIGQGPVLSVAIMLALAILLSVCSTVDAFVVLAFTGAFTSGSILAFLVYGPMVDIKSTVMFLRVFRPRVVAYLVLLPLLLTLVFSVFINYFGQGW